MMRVTLITDNDVVIVESLLQFSESQGVLNFSFMLKLQQVVTQYKMWNEAMLWLTQMMGYNAYIPLLIRQMKEENLNPTIFCVPDSTVIFCDYSMHEMDTQPN